MVQKLTRTVDKAERAAISETMSALIEEAFSQRNLNTLTRSKSLFAGGGRDVSKVLASTMLPDDLQSLLMERQPRRGIKDLVLSRDIIRDLKDFFVEFSQSAYLRAHSIEPRHTMLLVGPPGTGKTSLAEAIAFELGLPFLTVRYEGLVGSFLGETASRLQQIVDYVSRTPSVLFFDEFESIGKERGDTNETGEIKRVVSAFLMHMDALPANCIVICATNHPELLDRAAWRRFEMRLEIPLPGIAELKEWLLRTEKLLGPLGITAEKFVTLLKGESFSEIESITLDARRKLILAHGKLSPDRAFQNAVTSWQRRRWVGRGKLDGGEADRKDKSRTGKRRSVAGASALLPSPDLLGGPEFPSGE